jgi:dienelactone hydrolase
LRADVGVYRSRLRAALSAMAALPGVSGLPVAAIGYCMGGQAALELARGGAEIAGVVSFHGILQTGKPAAPGRIKARILVCHGDADPLAPRADVLAFWDEMDAAGANWHFHSYAGVKHGFTDPASDTRGIEAIAYNASADRQSWAAMREFFDEIF